MPPPNTSPQHRPSGSISQPWVSSDNDSSNPDTLYEIPLGGVQSGVADHPPPRLSDAASRAARFSADSGNPRTSGTAQRLAELRAEMKTNQDQIQQLTEAHQAVQNAVSGIGATQDLLRVSAANHPAHEDVPARITSTKTNASKYSEVQDMSERPEQPLSQPPNTERQGWVDEDYYESNPWYGQRKTKPVFSLGKPLPHRSRWTRKKNQKPQKSEPDPEKGQGSLKSKPSGKGKRVQISDPNESQRMMEKGDTGEGSTPNPWDVDFRVPDFDKGKGGQDDEERASGYEEGSKYKVDGEPIGQTEDDQAETGEKDPDDLRNWWARFRSKYPEPLAEFAATGMSVFLGLCATLSVNLSANQETQYGTYETACWAWGFAFMLGIYLGGGVSGAHMNPAISISLSIFRGFPWRQCGLYIVIQFIASITAGALAYGLYFDAIHHVDPELQWTYSSFFSYPQPWVSNLGAFFTQFVAGAVMMIAVFSLGDDQNNPPGAGLHAFILGLLQVALKFSLGYNTGSALNPASDFGPRLVAYAVGYRSETIFRNAWWLYGPWGGALAGSIAGATWYDAFIFVGSESPVNCRIPEAFRKRKNQMKNITKGTF